MDSLFKKLGIYDLMGVWAPGAIISVYSAFTLKLISSKVMEVLEISNKTALILLITVVSYLIGVILHEVGKLFTSRFDKSFNFKLMNISGCMNRGPFKRIYYDYFKSINNTMGKKHYESLRFEEVYLKLKYTDKIDISRLNKYHSIYGLSRGLFIGIIFHIVICLISIHFVKVPIHHSILIVDVILAFLFLIRTKRYFYDWIKNAYIQYYYVIESGNRTHEGANK